MPESFVKIFWVYPRKGRTSTPFDGPGHRALTLWSLSRKAGNLTNSIN